MLDSSAPAQRLGRRCTLALLLLLLLAAAACQPEEQEEIEEPPVRVQVADVMQRTLAETVRGIGTLRALNTVEIRPEIAGRITRIAFEEGGRVESGSVLFELDTRKLERELASARGALAAARARLENADRELRRVSRLFEQQVSTEDARDQAATGLDSARADVDRLEADVSLAEERLADATVRAPFAGRISEALVDAGDYVQTGAQLATLYQADTLEIEFTLPERHSGRIQPGQGVEITVSAYPERSFSALTTFVSPSVREQSRDFLVKARLENPDGLLMPGTFATAVLTVRHRENALVVPEESLIATRDGYMVFVASPDGTAASRQVQIGLREPGLVQITSGLSAGERVVRTGHLRVADGSPLEIVQPDGAAVGGA